MTPTEQSTAVPPLDISFPPRSGLAQDEEWCTVETEDGPRRVRFHDYARIFGIPGLYEQLFYGRLKCQSPQVVAGLLESALAGAGADPADLSVLDIGAGNGMVGAALRTIGVETLVGVDLLPEAEAAAERDRPGLYEDYFSLDLTALGPDDRDALAEHDLNALTCVAALGFGDMPPEAFNGALDLMSDGAWVALSIKEEFLDAGEQDSGFERLIAGMVASGELEIVEQQRYRHRLALDGTPLHYLAVVARYR